MILKKIIALWLTSGIHFHFIKSHNGGPTRKWNVHNQVCEKVVSVDAFMWHVLNGHSRKTQLSSLSSFYTSIDCLLYINIHPPLQSHQQFFMWTLTTKNKVEEAPNRTTIKIKNDSRYLPIKKIWLRSRKRIRHLHAAEAAILLWTNSALHLRFLHTGAWHKVTYLKTSTGSFLLIFSSSIFTYWLNLLASIALQACHVHHGQRLKNISSGLQMQSNLCEKETILSLST